MKRLIILLVLLAATSAWGTTGYLPLRFVVGDVTEDVDSVWAYVFYPDGYVDSLGLTKDSSGTVFVFADSLSVTLDAYYSTVFKVWYDDGTDSAQYAGDPILMPDPGTYKATGFSVAGDAMTLTTAERGSIEDSVHGNASDYKATGYAVAGDAMALTVAERGSIEDSVHANAADYKATGFSTLTTSSNIGINWGDVDNPTTVVGLSGTTIKASTDTETDIAALKDFDPASDSVLVDGSAFASQEGIIDAPHFTDSARHMIANRADSGSVSSGLDSAAVDVIVSVVVSDSNLARDITKDDYKAASGTGSSGVRCSVFVEESDHTPVTGVRIWLYNETKTSISYVNDNAGSNAAGYSIFQIPVDEIVYAQASRPGWNYDSATTYQYMDVGSGSDFYDTIPMTEIATPTGDSAAMCMLYGYVENGFGVKLPDVTIMVEMYLDEPGRERDNVMILKGVDYWTSNATGYFEGYVERSDSVSYASGNKMVVQFTIDGNKLDEQFAIPDTTQYEFVRLIVPDPD